MESKCRGFAQKMRFFCANPRHSDSTFYHRICSGTSFICFVQTPSYSLCLSTVICRSSHFFADDSRLHKSSVLSDFQVLDCSLKDCIDDVAEGMNDSKLKMNGDKSELMPGHCATFCFVSCTELENSAPSCPLMLLKNLMFLSSSIG